MTKVELNWMTSALMRTVTMIATGMSKELKCILTKLANEEQLLRPAVVFLQICLDNIT